jgi:hypothetical protein
MLYLRSFGAPLGRSRKLELLTGGLIVTALPVRNVRRTKSVGIGIHAVPVDPIVRSICGNLT